MSAPRTRTTVAFVAVLALAVVLAAVGYGGGRYWRRHAGASAAPSRVVVTVTAGAPTPTGTAPTDASRSASSSPESANAATVTVAPNATGSPAPVGPASAGPTASAAKVNAAVNAALHNAELGGFAGVHALIVDGRSGVPLYSHGAADSVPPASTNKLLTCAAVLATVGGAARVKTTVVAGAKPGQVVLVGGGDPTISAAPAGTPTIYDGAARLSTLVAKVRKSYKHKITSIVVDTSAFSGPTVAPGVAPEDVPSNYGSGIQSLMVDGGRTAVAGYARSARPAAEAGKAFATLLGNARIPVTAGRAAAGAKVLGSVSSAPMLRIIEQMLHDSDNTLADVLARQVAKAEHQPRSFAGAVVGVRTALAKIGIIVPHTLVDGSGLSVRDRVTPAVEVAVLRAVVAGKHPELGDIVPALPVAGWEGSLADRYNTKKGAVAVGDVRAKTGTLTDVVTLAGLVDDRAGRLLVFSVLLNKATDIYPARQALDEAIARLATCTCR